MESQLATAGSLYTNSNVRRDFLRSAFDGNVSTAQNVLVAVAFLTDADPLLKLAAAGSRVKVIVRLGYPTRPAALRRLLNVEGLQLRAVSTMSFHPKLYIFSKFGAIVGSSNMTKSALTSNQEVNVLIPTDDPRFEELVALFGSYWEQVVPLDETTVQKYEHVLDRFRSARKELEDMDTGVEALLTAQINNVERGSRPGRKEDFFIDEYRSEYQGFLDAFRTVQRVYQASGQRKYRDEVLPLRIEVDAFLGWIRSRYTHDKSYLDEPLRAGDALETKIRSSFNDWFTEDYRHIDDVALNRYPLISHTLRSPQAIAEASYEAILKALSCETSFYDRLRYFPGGHEAHIATFRAENSLERVRKTLSYLLFADDEPVVRMYRCVHDPEFRLREFGRSAVQELLGWVNAENVPICNSRTLRSLRWLGFDVNTYGG
jgi:HKD family nuclease